MAWNHINWIPSKLPRGFPSDKTSCFLFCIFCLCTASGSSNMNYRDIENLGSMCPKLDSCVYQRTIIRRQQTPIKERNCYCDFMCSEFGDCCIDAQRKTRGRRNGLHCLHVENIGGVYMKDSCPSSYKGPEEIKRRCEKTKMGDQIDPLGSIPVTEPQTGVTYKNYFCNLCNGKSNDIMMWSPKLECPLLSLLNTTKTLTRDYILRNLATDGHSWGLYFNDENNETTFFHDCYISAEVPASLESKIRPCKPHLISDCPASWNAEEIRAKCRSYTGVRFDPLGNAYRNVHCAVCNGANVTKLSCKSVDEADIFRDYGLYPFSILLDVSQTSGAVVGKVDPCTRGELFDPFFKKCRGITCLPGFVRVGNRCMVRNPVHVVRFLSAATKRMSTTSTTPKFVENKKNVTAKPDDLLLTSEPATTTLLFF